jgi:hypothetical protein
MTAKHKAHTVQPTPTPSQAASAGAAVGWALGSVFILSVPLLFIAFWVAVIRWVWKRGTAKAVQKGQ